MLSRAPLLLAAGALALGVTLAIALVSPQVRAGPPPPVTILDAAAVRDSGRGLTLAISSMDGVPLVDPQPAGRSKTPRPLAAAPDGMAMAVSTLDPGQVGPLTIARSDGSQLEVALPGVWGAAFEPGGTWLAVVDLSGALWRVDATSGAARRLADGPFGADPTVLPDGRVLVVELAAVDAPIWAVAAVVDAKGTVEPILGSVPASDQIVHGASALGDGSVAVVRHRTGGGISVVRIDARGEETSLAQLEGATGAAVSPDGARLAWAGGRRTWLASTDDLASAMPVGDGGPGRFSPDGSLLLLVATGAAAIVDAGGTRIGQAGPGACWLGDGRGCRP